VHIVFGHVVQHHANARVGLAKGTDGRRQQERALRVGRRHRHATARELGEVAGVGHQMLPVRHHPPGGRQQRAARLGEMAGARVAVEQARAQHALELAERRAQRRLRHAEPLGGTREMPAFGQRDEHAQLGQGGLDGH
jgi:hypothetical protein